MLFNVPSLWFHATQGAAEGRAIVLDFVGLGMLKPLSYIYLWFTPTYSLRPVKTPAPWTRLSHYIPSDGPHDYCIRSIPVRHQYGSRYPRHASPYTKLAHLLTHTVTGVNVTPIHATSNTDVSTHEILSTQGIITLRC